MRFALSLGLLLLPALAWAQPSTGYDYRLTGPANGALVFRAGTPHAATITIAGAVQAEGPLQARPDGWSLRQDEAAIDGILDRLPLVELGPRDDDEPLTWVVCGDPGAALFEVRLLRGHWVVARYHARLQITVVQPTRRGPIDAPLGDIGPVLDHKKLVRNRWWSRGAVGMWGTLRGVWDGIRGRDGTHFAGDATPQEIDRLQASLEHHARPWSMRTIYRAARRRTTSDDDALALCVGWALVHQGAPVRPMRGIPAGEPLHDKTLHFFVSAIMARRSNSTGSVSVGLLKELKDELPGGSGYNEHDVTADVWGALFGETLLLGEQLDP